MFLLVNNESFYIFIKTLFHSMNEQKKKKGRKTKRHAYENFIN